MKIPKAWLVTYMHYGEPREFITLEKSRAVEYAGLHHGTYEPLFKGAPAEATPIEENKSA
jgi:hypothetical protein